MTKYPRFLGVTEVGKLLGWDRRKVAVYRNRGYLPEPVAYVGNRPLWTEDQIKPIKDRLK